jgi:hypothetical protein
LIRKDKFVIVDLATLRYDGTRSRLTKINSSQIDKIISLANKFTDEIVSSAAAALDSDSAGDEEYDFAPALHEIHDAPQTAFCLYGLAIIHCYSNVEKNRGKIIDNHAHEIWEVTKHLKGLNIKHEDISSYNVMEKFRLVSNAVKHGPTYGRLEVTVKKSGEKFTLQKLRALYAERGELNRYLGDLYDKYRPNNGKPSP